MKRTIEQIKKMIDALPMEEKEEIKRYLENKRDYNKNYSDVAKKVETHIRRHGHITNKEAHENQAEHIGNDSHTVHCTSFNLFRQSATGSYLSLTRGAKSRRSRTVECTAAANIISALHNGKAGSWTCNNLVWRIGTCGSGVEICAGCTNVCSCDTNQVTIRPCSFSTNRSRYSKFCGFHPTTFAMSTRPAHQAGLFSLPNHQHNA